MTHLAHVHVTEYVDGGEHDGREKLVIEFNVVAATEQGVIDAVKSHLEAHAALQSSRFT